MKSLVVLLLLFIAAAVEVRTAKTEKNARTKFDSVILSIWNRAGFCSSPKQRCIPKCDSGHPTWTIAGFWPHIKGRENIPSVCDVITPPPARWTDHYTKAKLYQFWPSFNSTNRELWDNEYTKYGQCYNSTLADYYFVKALNVYDRQRISLWHELGTATPSNFVPVSTKSIEDHLRQIFYRGQSELYCEGTLAGMNILQGIRLCFDITNLEPSMNCDLPRSNCETRYIWYLESGATKLFSTHVIFAIAASLVVSVWHSKIQLDK